LLGAHPGWKISADVGDGYEAVQAAIRVSPDVVIIDSAMRRMNGIEATRRILQHLPKTAVCIFTDCVEEAIIAGALRVGARGFVLKSDAEEELLAAVEALSNHHPHFSWVVSEALLNYYVKETADSSSKELLTPREREVVQLVAEGLSNKQVSRQLALSIKTVETHRGAAMRKAGLSSTADLVRYAVRNHLVQP
jgi:DNA-binding NarL/FixJ family response regulator